jgi:hypothetical protein
VPELLTHQRAHRLNGDHQLTGLDNYIGSITLPAFDRNLLSATPEPTGIDDVTCGHR